jgi:tetratricopeptide (TPR) repeat protein
MKSISVMAIPLLVAGSVGLAMPSISRPAAQTSRQAPVVQASESPSSSGPVAGADPRLSDDPILIAIRNRKAKATEPNPSSKQFKIKIEREVVMADELMLKGRYSDAADLYRSVVAKNPKSVPAVVGYGMALAKQFKLDAANDQFDKALQMDPQNAMAHSGKAMVAFNRLQSSSGTVMKNRDAILQQAEAETKAGLAIDPGMPEAHYTLGMIYKDQGKVDDSINEFNQAVKLDPQYSEAYSGLGVADLQKGDLPGAITAFKQAVTLNSGNSTGHYGLGTAYVRQGLYDDAIKELNTSLYQFPNSAPAHLSLGQAYAGQGNTVGAVKEFQESIRIKPENSQAYLGIADIREQRGDLELAISDVRSGLELMPTNVDLHQRVADTDLKLEKLDDAIKEYKGVLDANPSNAQAARGLSRAYYMKANKEANSAFFTSNEFENAKNYLDQTVKMNPNDMELRLAQAKLRAMSGEKVDLSSIGTPTNDGERIAYAEALLAQNKFKEADEQMNHLISTAQDPKQTFAVADLALMIKDLPSAEAAYKKGATFPGGTERAKRGLDQIAKAKDQAKQDLTLADDLAKRKQLASAIDKYHASIYENPKVAETRLGVAQTLERVNPPSSGQLREAITQYRVYLDLAPNLPPKELEKINKKITQLSTKADKVEAKERANGTRPTA